MNRAAAALIGAFIVAAAIIAIVNREPEKARVVGVRPASPAEKIEQFCAEIGWNPSAFLVRHPGWDNRTTRAIACDLCSPWLEADRVCPSK
jgi:hypothetical protein